MTTVKLSPSEEKLIASIIEHIYPEPKEGSVLPVEDGEKRAARGLERKGLVVLSICERGFDRMTFTALGQSIYERQLAAANSKEITMAEQPVIAWKVEFEDGSIELWLAKDVQGTPAFGRWVTPLIAGTTVDLAPEQDGE